MIDDEDHWLFDKCQMREKGLACGLPAVKFLVYVNGANVSYSSMCDDHMSAYAGHGTGATHGPLTREELAAWMILNS